MDVTDGLLVTSHLPALVERVGRVVHGLKYEPALVGGTVRQPTRPEHRGWVFGGDGAKLMDDGRDFSWVEFVDQWRVQDVSDDSSGPGKQGLFQNS